MCCVNLPWWSLKVFSLLTKKERNSTAACSGLFSSQARKPMSCPVCSQVYIPSKYDIICAKTWLVISQAINTWLATLITWPLYGDSCLAPVAKIQNNKKQNTWWLKVWIQPMTDHGLAWNFVASACMCYWNGITYSLETSGNQGHRG